MHRKIEQACVFQNSGWYRGNLHTHTTRSDGKVDLRDAVNWYRDHGYDFVAITDHNVFYGGERYEDFFVFSGIEMSTHTVGFGMRSPVNFSTGSTQQEEIDLINRAHGISVVAHPYWHGLSLPYLESLQGYLAVEIYNSECDVLNGRGFASTLWDYLLAQGKRVLGLAVDDAHWGRGSEGHGWISVNADALCEEDIFHQIKKGKFYASQGPSFKQIYIEPGRIGVACSPVQRINFISDAPFGSVVQAGASLVEEGFFNLRPGLTYVRIEIIDEQGKMAWSNPIWLDSRR